MTESCAEADVAVRPAVAEMAVAMATASNFDFMHFCWWVGTGCSAVSGRGAGAGGCNVRASGPILSLAPQPGRPPGTSPTAHCSPGRLDQGLRTIELA